MMRYRVAQETLFVINELIEYLQKDSETDLLNVRDKVLKSVDYDELTSRNFNPEASFPIIMNFGEMADILGDSESMETAIQGLLNLKKSISSKCQPLKIAFITHEFSLWPSFQSIWEACPQDIDKSIVVVYGLGRRLSDEELDVYAAPYRQAGYNVRTANNYDPEMEQPDIVFYMKPYRGFRSCPEEFYINKVKKITPFTVFVSYCLDVQGGELLQEYFYGQPFFYHVWRVIGYSKYYRNKMIERGYRDAENVVLMGHPKFDVAFKLGNEKSYIHESWQKKINLRKVIMWNSHFTIEPGFGVGTFLRWYKTIFEYFNNHEDVVLLWRPHPIFWQKIEELPDLEKSSIKRLIDQERKQQNVIVDDSSDYRYAFCMSDALISDAATFLVEYAATARPILYTVKPDGEKVCNDDYLAGIHIAEKEDDIILFMNNIRAGIIDSSEVQQNKQMFEEIFGKCDGNVGNRILNYVLKEMENEIAIRAKKRLILKKGVENDALE